MYFLFHLIVKETFLYLARTRDPLLGEGIRVLMGFLGFRTRRVPQLSQRFMTYLEPVGTQWVLKTFRTRRVLPEVEAGEAHKLQGSLKKMGVLVHKPWGVLAQIKNVMISET